jgi:hypothetical protein
MKLLSDFDGVWTYPDEEGAAHGAALDAALEAALGEGERPAVRAWITAARAVLRSEPARWGWSSAGRISAFADEDPFTEHGALLYYLEQARGSDPLAAQLAAAVEVRDGSLDAFGGRVHVGGVRDVEARRGPGITPAAATAGRELLARGIDIVVVSNSGTEAPALVRPREGAEHDPPRARQARSACAARRASSCWPRAPATGSKSEA